MYGCVEWISSLQMHAIFFVFDDVTDPHLNARQYLPTGHMIHRCPVGICFTDTIAGSCTNTIVRQTAGERRHEFFNLYNWLIRTARYSQVHAFPTESLLCSDDGGTSSVAEQIRLHLPQNPQYPGPSRIVFIRPTVSAVVFRAGLIRRVISYVIDQLLTARHNVFIVTDVDSSVVLSQADVMPFDCIKASIYSGLKHLYAPISAVIIQLTLLVN